MTAQPPRSYTKLAMAVIVAALIIGSVVYLTTSTNSKTKTLTLTFTTTSATSLTTTLTTTVTASCDSSPSVHCVVFQQLGACNPEFWGVPWSVTIGGTTEVQPPSAQPPGADSGLAGTMDGNLTVIVFSLPDGVYNFTVRPSNEYFTPSSGVVSVNGADVLVQIAYTGTSCTAIATSSTTSAALVTGTSSTVTPTDTYLSSCSVTGIGGFELRIVSDSTGAPVSGENVNAVDRLGCNSETQVVYLDAFSVGQGGWLTPVFPQQAQPGGQLAFIVVYQGKTYSFTSTVPPIGWSCATLRVPSGNVTTTSTMNGPCS
jgi:hypothetical protein